ncbi:mitochondrial ribosome-associated GTPase 1 isoform 1-T1 [Chlamydotis macqueenii]
MRTLGAGGAGGGRGCGVSVPVGAGDEEAGVVQRGLRRTWLRGGLRGWGRLGLRACGTGGAGARGGHGVSPAGLGTPRAARSHRRGPRRLRRPRLRHGAEQEAEVTPVEGGGHRTPPPPPPPDVMRRKRRRRHYARVGGSAAGGGGGRRIPGALRFWGARCGLLVPGTHGERPAADAGLPAARRLPPRGARRPHPAVGPEPQAEGVAGHPPPRPGAEQDGSGRSPPAAGEQLGRGWPGAGLPWAGASDASARPLQAVLEQLKEQGCSHVIFTDCQRDGNIKKIVPLVAKLVGNSPRYHRAESAEYSILVIGIPNVGKSSLINSLRRLHLKKGKATAVGGEPGITKAVLTRIQVCEQPLMYLVDTPGVLPPRLGDVETGMKLALCGAIRDHLVGEDIMADYLLYTLNKRQQFGYVRRYGLAEACDDVEAVLRRVALARGRTQKVKVLTGTGNVNVTMLDYPAAAYEFLRDFRAGHLGRVTLD